MQEIKSVPMPAPSPEEVPACEAYFVHTEIPRRALQKLPEENTLIDLA